MHYRNDQYIDLLFDNTTMYEHGTVIVIIIILIIIINNILRLLFNNPWYSSVEFQ